MECSIEYNLIDKYLDNYYSQGIKFSDKLFLQIGRAIAVLNDNSFQLVKFEKDIFTKKKTSLVNSVIRKLENALSFDSLLFNAMQNTDFFFKEINKCVSNISDFFRINVLIKKDDDFENKSILIIKSLLNVVGIKLNFNKSLPFKNSFAIPNGCKDFKVFFVYNNYPLELQLHNSSSENINLNTHGIYEVYRARDLQQNYKTLLGKDRIGLYNLVTIPPFDEKKIMKDGANYEI